MEEFKKNQIKAQTVVDSITTQCVSSHSTNNIVAAAAANWPRHGLALILPPAMRQAAVARLPLLFLQTKHPEWASSKAFVKIFKIPRHIESLVVCMEH